LASYRDGVRYDAPLARQGKTRALAVTNQTRSADLPGVPTVAESGVPGYDVTIWYAMLGPAKMPANIVDTLYKRLTSVMAQPKVKESLARIGTDPMLQPPDQLAKLVRDDSEKWGKIVKLSGAKAD
jgi:tripartite-type tricarboxylate transporter receptor subunit TctC